MKHPQPAQAGRSSRGLIVIGALVLILLAGGAGYYFWDGSQSGIGREAEEQAAALDQQQSELMQPGPLPDIVLGNAEAPVTIVEYSSLTCPHCASFHRNVLPKLKQQYIDSGKARYIVRQFPLDNVAAAAGMLALCLDKDRYYPFLDALYDQQQRWAHSEGDPLPRLQAIAKQAGFTEESFRTCLSDQKLLDNMMAVRNRAAEKFGVNSTPTFFVNGKLLKGVQSVEEFEKLMPPQVVNKTS